MNSKPAMSVLAWEARKGGIKGKTSPVVALHYYLSNKAKEHGASEEIVLPDGAEIVTDEGIVGKGNIGIYIPPTQNPIPSNTN